MVGIERHAGADALDDTLRRVLVPFVRPDGTVRLDNTFRFVVGSVRQP